MNTQEHIKHIYDILGDYDKRITGARQAGGNHNLLSAVHPDTDPVSPPTRGSIIRGSAGGEWEEYGIGVVGRFLRSDGNDPLWAVIQAGDLPAHAAEHEVGGGDLVDHDDLTNFVANEHLDHTGISINSGTGLTGGGTIAANRTISLSHLGLEALVDPGADRIMFWDDSATALKWLTATEGVQINLTNLLLDINGLVEDAAGTSGDFFVYYDTVAGDHKKIDWDDMPGGGGASPWTVAGVDIWWNGGGIATIGTVDHDSKMTEGLCLYQGSADDIIQAFQSSDIGHGITDLCDTDTYGFIKKTVGASGGLTLYGLTELFSAFEINGVVLSDLAVSWTQTNAPVIIEGFKKSGTGTTYISNNDISFAVHNANYPRFIVDGEGNAYVKKVLFIYDTVNTKMTQGVTIQQSGYDDEILSFKSTDVNHGMTTQTEFDTYGYMKKILATSGGLAIFGLTETQIGVNIVGVSTTDNTIHGDGSAGVILLKARKKSGTTWGACGAEANLVVIGNHSTEVWGCDAEGDVWMGQFLQMNHPTNVVIRPNIDSGYVTIYGSYNQNEGAKIEFFGGDHGATPGNIYLDYGDFTKVAPAGAVLNIRAMDNGATITALRCDITGHVDIWDWDDSVLREIDFGIDDSGGAGFKLLRIPN